jgi:hypothetical protein
MTAAPGERPWSATIAGQVLGDFATRELACKAVDDRLGRTIDLCYVVNASTRERWFRRPSDRAWTRFPDMPPLASAAAKPEAKAAAPSAPIAPEAPEAASDDKPRRAWRADVDGPP